MDSWGRELGFPPINDPREPWGTPEPLRTFSKNIKNHKHFFSGCYFASLAEPRIGTSISVSGSKNWYEKPQTSINDMPSSRCYEPKREKMLARAPPRFFPIWGKVTPLAHPLHARLTHPPCGGNSLGTRQ